ncbi:SMC-Scp complex subunit ScpB [[Eubacterium] cellulosolvens]
MAAKTKPELLIEASLFSAGRPLSVEELAEGLELSRDIVSKNIKKLMNYYSSNDSALEIIKAGTKYSMQVRSQLSDYVRSFAQMEIPNKVLKTAALIGYHQPIKQSELQEMYGSKVYDHVKVLNELGLIKKRHHGRTIVLTTTQQFSEYFGIDTTNRDKVKEWLIKKVKKENIRRKKELVGEED